MRASQALLLAPGRVPRPLAKGVYSHEPHGLKPRRLVPVFTRFSDYPEKLPDETIGCMTSAQYQCGLTFLRGKTLVATTHMLLFMYKRLLSPGGECLSTIVLSRAEDTSIWLP